MFDSLDLEEEGGCCCGVEGSRSFRRKGWWSEGEEGSGRLLSLECLQGRRFGIE